MLSTRDKDCDWGEGLDLLWNGDESRYIYVGFSFIISWPSSSEDSFHKFRKGDKSGYIYIYAGFSFINLLECPSKFPCFIWALSHVGVSNAPSLYKVVYKQLFANRTKYCSSNLLHRDWATYVYLTSTTRIKRIHDQLISVVKYLDYDELKVHIVDALAFR